ncbi:unnamed protein product [Ceratitis capitata]|uniref:(Mediterranean fruit fly) hypothetical protein n=1 Tax=Ceratitis capitata TaxID=7213 RepID=A0A811UQ54_CERCA|nr:unnamed protein product [Ceratitis capitata]
MLRAMFSRVLRTACVNIQHRGSINVARVLIDSGSNANMKGVCYQEWITHQCVNFYANGDACATPANRELSTCEIYPMVKPAFPEMELADKRFFGNEEVDLVLGRDVCPRKLLGGATK